MLKKLLLLPALWAAALHAQVVDSTSTFFLKPKDSLQDTSRYRFNVKQLIIPAVLLGYGIVGLESESLKGYNKELRAEVTEHIDEKLTIDDFSQYTPMLSVYALNAAGVKGKHNFRERTIIMGTAYLIMAGTVTIIKNTSTEYRPDGTSNNSFPSGHTATAFSGAEFLWQEYKDVSVGYGIAGYVVAAGTGAFRIYNNRHWLSDVAAGAGIGILSTKIAYWAYPWLNRHIFGQGRKNSNTVGMVVPYYNGTSAGCALMARF